MPENASPPELDVARSSVMPETVDSEDGDILPSASDKLIAACIRVRQHAYCPYSLFPVGSAVLTKSGEVFEGANVENIAFPNGWCAECSAIGAAVSSGQRKIMAVAVTTAREAFVLPCGRCRQVISEFAEPGAMLYLVNVTGKIRAMRFHSTLPQPLTTLN
ncbi:unnamed protein product [Protopolystoma xenopodis]|uniref:Cytidine deaminase n=1 Tax=Protopolystoma xenopodis TaxID=117903 RepID=A0A3S4ZG99_9PLAT|nr:unnamed protein product [Protopolystoma xenopodis]